MYISHLIIHKNKLTEVRKKSDEFLDITWQPVTVFVEEVTLF